MIKKMIAGFLAITMIMAAAGCAGSRAPSATTQKAAEQETQAEAGQSQASAEDWYKEVLADEATKKQYSYYKLLDINQDGTEELFLSTTEKYFIGAEDKACLMADENGEVKTLQEIGGAGGEYWIYNQSDATLSYYSRFSGESHIVLYRLEDGALTEISTADYYSPHHYTEEDNEEEIYLLDGKKADKKEAESYWEQYGNEAGAITYEAIGD